MRRPNGFTLIELLMGLVLASLVGGAVLQVLTNNQRVYRQQIQRADVNQTARAALSILPNEIRELNAADPAGSDILAMTSTLLRYKSMRNLYGLCQAPNVGASQLVLWNTVFYGLRPLDPTRDSILVFAEGDPTTRTDDQWLHANVSSAVTGTACPSGDASLTITVTGLTAAELGLIEDGSLLRGFEVSEVSLYTDGLSDVWLGSRRFVKSSGTWTTIEPLIGPLASGGLQLAYFDTAGVATAVPAEVARIAITVEGKSRSRVRGTNGTDTDYLLQDLVTSVSLRNNPLY